MTTSRIPVALYVCTTDPDVSALVITHCRTYAAELGWPVVDVISDTDRAQDLADRPGWGRVAMLLAAGDARGVLTYSPAMVAPGQPEQFARLRAQLSEHGVAIACAQREARTANPAVLPTRRVLSEGARAVGVTDDNAGCFTPRQKAAEGNA